MSCASGSSTADTAASGAARSQPAAAAGRFAPSPSGPLHFGSLIAAVASFLDARHHEAAWRLRIDDIDTPRTVRGAEDAICRSLEQHALTWDGPRRYQSNNLPAYASALERLVDQQRVFYCRCSRRQLAGHPTYPGICRNIRTPPAGAHAVRVRASGRSIAFVDECQGPQALREPALQGDFVVRRRDGLFSYQLAVVVDDALDGITRVVRGCDLIDNTERQLLLARWLGLPRPVYLHIATVQDRRGDKLSKQTQARPLQPQHAAANLQAALELLGQAPPADSPRWQPEALIAWAQQHYRPQRLPAQARIQRFTAI